MAGLCAGGQSGLREASWEAAVVHAPRSTSLDVVGLALHGVGCEGGRASGRLCLTVAPFPEAGASGQQQVMWAVGLGRGQADAG